MDLLFRFLAGGCMVSLFAIIGDVLQPKSFAGLFGAAPSVALASLGLVIASRGSSFAAAECRSMMLGAVAFGCYCAAVTLLIARRRVAAWKAALGSLAIWFAVALGLWLIVFE